MKTHWCMVGYQVCLQFHICSHLSDQGWIGAESCAPGVAGYDLGGPISPEHVDPSHCSHLYLNVHSFQW